MAITNNTKYRRSTLTINKKVNGILETTGGFPVTVSILTGFTDPGTAQVYPLLTSEEFSLLSDPQYNTRLNAFYNYLENTYTFFQRTAVQNVSSGTDAVICPIDNSVPAEPTVSNINLSMIAVSVGNQQSHLVWIIVISAPSTVDLNYMFDVEFADNFSNVVTTITVQGIIPAGVTALDVYAATGESIYIIEADTTLNGPLVPSVVPGTIQLFS